jgi:hypothetical protein
MPLGQARSGLQLSSQNSLPDVSGNGLGQIEGRRLLSRQWVYLPFLCRLGEHHISVDISTSRLVSHRTIGTVRLISPMFSFYPPKQRPILPILNSASLTQLHDDLCE